MNLSHIPIGSDAPHEVNVVIEIPQGGTPVACTAFAAWRKIAGNASVAAQNPQVVSMRTNITNIVGALCTVAMVGSANAAIREEPVTYMDGATTMKWLRRIRRCNPSQAARDRDGA
jgi:hypothetical protein